MTRAPVRHVVAHLVRTELRLLVGMTAVSVSLWGFLSVMAEVREGDTYRLDSAILLALRRPGALGVPIGPRWLQETARDITALGGFTVLGLVVVLSAAMLWLHRRRLQALVLAGAVVVGQVAAEGTKLLVGRGRPDLVPHLDQVYSSSFPSGHSASSSIVYFTLAGILAAGEPSRAAKLMLLGGAPLDGPRHMWWNFVSSSLERIEKAKADWKEGRFAKVPGDKEFIPLPDR